MRTQPATHHLLRTGFVAAAALLCLLLASCGGSSKSSTSSGGTTGSGATAGSGLDPKNAQAQAHAALLKTTDLSGSGWQVAQTDVFDEDSSSVSNASTPECTHHGQVWQDVLGFRGKLAGRASVVLSTQSKTPSIEEWVEVYQTPQDASDLMGKMRVFLGDEGYTCEQQQTETSAIHVTRPQASTTVPNGGVVLTQEVNVPAAQVTVRREYYYWVEGNTGVSLVFIGAPKQLTPELISGAVSKAQANLKAAASVK